MSEMKKCKHCQSEIDKKAKICPHCRKKQGGRAKFVIIGIIVLFILIGALGSNDDKSTDTASSNSIKTDTAKETEKPIEYTAYKVSDMMGELDSNALKAEEKYSDQYVEITGKLSNIDSDGKYISLTSDDDIFSIIGVQCYIKTDEQKTKVMEMSTDDIVTIKGKITSIGEVLGYSLDITEIE